MTNRTSLYQNHLDAGAKMVDFSGWEMPINYGSQIEEHTQVRTAAGVFDVSHMTVVDVSGETPRRIYSIYSLMTSRASTRLVARFTAACSTKTAV